MKSQLILLIVLVLLSIAKGQVEAKKVPCTPEASYTPCPSCLHSDQNALDECYMREALAFGKTLNPARPFGALIVDHSKNVISCYGVNSANTNILLHGETSAFFNCTALYPSPTNDDRGNPGLYWGNQTLYTTGEPCPMCSTQAIWRGVGRVVYATNIPTLARIGSKQIMIRTKEIFQQAILQQFKLGTQGNVPFLKENVLREECDRAFYSGFGMTYPENTLLNTDEDVFYNN